MLAESSFLSGAVLGLLEVERFPLLVSHSFPLSLKWELLFLEELLLPCLELDLSLSFLTSLMGQEGTWFFGGCLEQ